jgi:hypothetical protein
MPRTLSENERQRIVSRSHLIADQLIRLGREYIKCVTAPNRQENGAAEANFADALADVVVMVVESDV